MSNTGIAVSAVRAALSYNVSVTGNTRQFDAILQDCAAALKRQERQIIIAATACPVFVRRYNALKQNPSNQLSLVGVAVWLENNTGFKPELCQFAEDIWSQSLGVIPKPQKNIHNIPSNKSNAVNVAEDKPQRIASLNKYKTILGLKTIFIILFLIIVITLLVAFVEGFRNPEAVLNFDTSKPASSEHVQPKSSNDDTGIVWPIYNSDQSFTSGNKESKTLLPDIKHDQEKKLQVGQEFTDSCVNCSQDFVFPSMRVVPAGKHLLGVPAGSEGRYKFHESPEVLIEFTKPFAMGIREISVAEWQACYNDGGCPSLYRRAGCHTASRLPINCISYRQAFAYTVWLSQKTQQRYRLPSESEWEYSALAGKNTNYYWGDTAPENQANCLDCKTRWQGNAAPVQSFGANPWGFYDVHGNVWEIVADCYSNSLKYIGALNKNGTALKRKNSCMNRHVARGGGYKSTSIDLRATNRVQISGADLSIEIGFRVARDIE